MNLLARRAYSAFERLSTALEAKICGINPFLTIFDYQFLGVRTRQAKVKSYLSRSNGLTIIDVGCGSQPYRRLLADGCRYLGIDIHRGHPDTIVVAPGSAWPELEAADVVVCTEVIEHVKDLRAFCLEIDRVLKPGGQLIVSAPFLYKVHDLHDYRRLTVDEYQNHFPYEVQEITKLGRIGTVVAVNFLAWFYTELCARRTGRILYTLFLPVRIPINLCVNILAMAVDRLDSTGMFYGGSIALMRKPDTDATVRPQSSNTVPI